MLEYQSRSIVAIPATEGIGQALLELLMFGVRELSRFITVADGMLPRGIRP